MTIRVALRHETAYTYDRPISLAPQLIRLRPAPHARTPVLSYSLQVEPSEHFENWQQDPHGNFLARCVFPKKTREFRVGVDLVADMTVINPFDFFVEPSAETWPFEYEPWLTRDLRPYLERDEPGPLLSRRIGEIHSGEIQRKGENTIDFLVDLNRRLEEEIRYLIRMEPGVQSPEETLEKRSGSCRDTAWLFVQILRGLGVAARFTSGYLIQLAPDLKALDGPSGPEADFTDLHAWTEAYIPGAGWIGLDPTSGLLAGEGHIPLACTPEPSTAAPISGDIEACESTFDFDMSVTRIHEDPRVTKPYSDQQWERICSVGEAVDGRLEQDDVRLTMGGEPTFVSIDDMDGAEWTVEAVGPDKRLLAEDLLKRLQRRFAPGGLLHFGQGKWYPGEPLPRWAFTCLWRTDGEPLWRDTELIAEEGVDYGSTHRDAHRFVDALTETLQLDADCAIAAYEDVWHHVEKERRLPVNVDVHDNKLDDPEERARMARVFEGKLTDPIGFVLPLRRQWWQAKPRWVSNAWPLRTEHLFLLPGDSPIGLRLPLDSLPWSEATEDFTAQDPTTPRGPLPPTPSERVTQRSVAPQGAPDSRVSAEVQSAMSPTAGGVSRAALCVEPRGGQLHVFMPPTERLEDYLDLVNAVEAAAKSSAQRVVVEGYLPPEDHRLHNVKVTPDPGVIEVNTQPASSWKQLVDSTTALYEEAREARLGTEKFDIDGRHTGTGGGNHVVLGGPSPADSPFLRRPDLLKSLIAYWNNHPSLSYLFSGTFIGPTSQAPRVDEGRRDALYELEIAFEQVPAPETEFPLWLTDRIFRNLLVDVTGNTHRAEFCIDKLYSPDSSTGRLGLVEFRGLEMPPHARMSLTQQLLLRALIARFWKEPYTESLVHWGTTLHDRFLLPQFVWSDFSEVIASTRTAGIELEREWFAAHFDFRFPRIGTVEVAGLEVELRQAIEPWYVLGEEPGASGTTRYVDSSVERLQVRVQGMTDSRHLVTCNRRRVPLHSTGTEGEYVGAVRYRAWQPPSCLHPAIPVHAPLTIDVFDTWNRRSVGGCVYHTTHPAGRNYESFPVNANEADARRAARFFASGHSPGSWPLPASEPNPLYPLTLDLRRDTPGS